MTTAAKSAGGGKINVETNQPLQLTQSELTTSVQDGTGNGGDVTIKAKFVILENGQLLALPNKVSSTEEQLKAPCSARDQTSSFTLNSWEATAGERLRRIGVGVRNLFRQKRNQFRTPTPQPPTEESVLESGIYSARNGINSGLQHPHQLLEKTMKNYQPTILKLSITICLTTFLLLGCTSPISEANYQKIQNGMTLEQVKAVLGEPTEAKTAGLGPLSGTAATWKHGDLTISIQLLNNKVQLKSMTGGK